MNREGDTASALEAFRRALGDGRVLAGAEALAPYRANVSGLERDIAGVVQPETTEEVVAVVQAANLHRTPLYPVGCGRNWGLGSRLPVRDGAVVVDLSRMCRIRDVNVRHHYAVVEPGVTQEDLYQYLATRGLPLLFNVTGSGRKTSLLGNALERGIGYFSSRAEELSGLEVVLGSGEVVRTGCGHFPSSRITHLYKHGIGPGLDGLFFQSNFGIVTAAGLELMPAAEAHTALIARIEAEETLAAFVDALADLRRREIIRTAAHIGDRARTEISLAPLVHQVLLREGGEGADLRAEAEALLRREGFGPWSAVAGLHGTRGQLRDARACIRDRLRGVARVAFIDAAGLARATAVASRLRFLPALRRKLALLEAITPLHGLSRGVPTDEPIRSVYWSVDRRVPEGDLEPDTGDCGMLYVLPMMPMEGEAAVAVVREARAVFGRHGFTAYITLNMVNTKALEAVINLGFDRTQRDRVEAAHAAVRELESSYLAQGYIPYRMGVQSQPGLPREDDTFWRTVRDLKRVLDPNGIIAPGRYNLA